MPVYKISVPGQGTFRVDSPVELTDAQAYAAIQEQLGKAPSEKSGFIPALKSGARNLAADTAATLGRAGIIDLDAAERFRAEQEQKAQVLVSQRG